MGQPGKKPQWFPLIVLVACLALTAFATQQARRSVRLQNQSRFESAVEQAQAALQVRMEAYIALLRGGTAFLAGNPMLTRSQFHAFVERLRLYDYYPGIQGFGFTARVLPENRAGFVEQMRAQGFTNYVMWPEHSGPEYHAIAYLEPMDIRNQRALGFDMFTESVRREAMAAARDSGGPVASGKVRLVQEMELHSQAGFLIYLPTYEGGDVPTTVQHRRQLLTGFIYSPFRADDLFRSIYATNDFGLEREVYDGIDPLPDRLLHSSMAEAVPASKGTMTAWRQFEIAGRTWTIRLIAGPQFRTLGISPWSVAAAGAFLSLVLFHFTRAEARARQDAEAAADRLRASEHSLLEARSQLHSYATDLEKMVSERTRRLQQSLEALEGVLYHVAHDLRAPLRAMAGFAQILQQEYRDRFDTAGTSYLERIFKGAQRMDKLLNDLLAYGRLTHMAMPTTPVDLSEQVKEALVLLDRTIQERRAQIVIQEPLPCVEANASVLREALRELLSNSVKFVAPGVQPKVQVRAEKNGRVRLWVEDNGIGIDPQYQDRVFRVFERLHTGEAYPGTGIGLAIVQKAVERMGGEVGVQSQPGHGSRFWIELPAA